jgi:glycosyltransferase involved in cell wall biosynthesis
LDWFRCARFSTDLALATRRCTLAVTAHNLHAHNRAGEPFAFHNTRSAFRRARAVFAHSEVAKAKLIETHGLAPGRVCVIPVGDLSVAMPPPPSRSEARSRLGLGMEKICLMFGAVEPYKGIEEVLAHWRHARPGTSLVIAGNPITPEYGEEIRRAADGMARVTLDLKRLSDPDLACWLSAADCVLFNYRTIFTSGAAMLARSWGVPVLLPARLDTVDLAEPSRLVWRFHSFEQDFGSALAGALATPPDFGAAADWRTETSWSEIARRTALAYRS